MTSVYDFPIKPGLPLNKEINVTLPSNRDWWLAVEDFEIIMQGREEKNGESPLVMDFSPFLTVTMPAANNVKIKVQMTGNQTRQLMKSCYFDIYMSDAGMDDARAYVILCGRIRKGPSVSSPEENSNV